MEHDPCSVVFSNVQAVHTRGAREGNPDDNDDEDDDDEEDASAEG